MRGLITQALTQHERLGDLALGQATGQQIADSFFGSCRYLGELDSAERSAERNIANQLQTETGERIVERNKIMHGDWWVGGDPEGSRKILERARLVRFYPNARDGDFQRLDNYTIDELDVNRPGNFGGLIA